MKAIVVNDCLTFRKGNVVEVVTDYKDELFIKVKNEECGSWIVFYEDILILKNKGRGYFDDL